MTDLKVLARRFYDEVMSGGDIAALDDLVDDDFVEHEELPGLPGGKEGLVAFVTTTRAALPDLTVEVLGMAADGDEVWVHAVMRGTQRGEFMGIPATGRKVEVPMVDRVRVRDGKAVEHWGVTDMLAMMQQLGVVPEEPPG